MRTLAVLALIGACFAAKIDNEIRKSKDNYGIQKVKKPDHLKVENLDHDAAVMDMLEGDSDATIDIANYETGFTCSLCTQVLSVVQTYVKTHEGSIPEILDQVCYNLFSKHSSELMLCETLVKTELKTIIDFIEKGADPTTTCAALAFC